MAIRLFRIILPGILILGLFGAPAVHPVRAGGLGQWTVTPPSIDGVATDREWADAEVISSYTAFQVRYQNDANFMYFLIDVTADTHQDALGGTNDNFVIMVDADQNHAPTAGVDIGYSLYSVSPNRLYQVTPTSSTSWSSMAPALSYASAGFGSSPASLTPHRTYEAAIRLSEIRTLPGHSVLAGFRVFSASPAINESHPADVYSMNGFTSLGMGSPRVAFIYNTDAGYSDALVFRDVLYNTVGIWAEFVPLGQVEMVDFSPYQSIIVGDDTGSSSGRTWLGTAAALDKIRQSGKPVLGIGDGGAKLFDSLGLYIGHGNTWESPDFRTIMSLPLQHPAWKTPNAVSTGNPLALYSVNVIYHAVYADPLDMTHPAPPMKALTRLGVDPSDSHHYTIIGERSNGICYTLWGFRSQPLLMTVDGARLFSNMVWNPPCMPSVLYLSGTNDTLRNQVMTMFSDAGFYTLFSPASGAATQDFTGFGLVVVGWDTRSAWGTAANVNAIRNSRLPVFGMGDGGSYLYQVMKDSLAYFVALNPITGSAMTNPLQPAMLYPNPVLVNSELNATLDASGGVSGYLLVSEDTPLSLARIGYYPSFPDHNSIFTRGTNGSCYSFWGLQQLPNNMTPLAKNLFLNMAATPRCNFPVFLPGVLR